MQHIKPEGNPRSLCSALGGPARGDDLPLGQCLHGPVDAPARVLGSGNVQNLSHAGHGLYCRQRRWP
jgi:hypothetical protein